ncbi:MAG TPA: hypothetical protein VFT50_06860 [Baekduia sp.]|nr:hypothetical protein [Baekduia sp.]
MRRALLAPHGRLLRTTIVVGAIAGSVAGCGSSDHQYRNGERPPAPIVVSASISDHEISVSPKRLGAGPITLVISNQSTAAQQITLETSDAPGGGPGVTAVRTGPINPRETASVKADVAPGSYDLGARGSDVRAAHLVVGHERPSSQNDLLQP